MRDEAEGHGAGALGAFGMDMNYNHKFLAGDPGTPTFPPGTGDPNDRIAFSARPDGNIDVWDTFFYGQIGTIVVRDPITGPLRVARNRANTRQWLFGVTSAGLVMIELTVITNPSIEADVGAADPDQVKPVPAGPPGCCLREPDARRARPVIEAVRRDDIPVHDGRRIARPRPGGDSRRHPRRPPRVRRRRGRGAEAAHGGYGRGARMKIESDHIEWLSGVRAGETLGSRSPC